MRPWKLATAIYLIVAPAVVQAVPPVAPAEPAQHPEWKYVRTEGERLIKTTLYDPASAQFEWTSGFAWGRVKRPLGRSRWAWVACLDMNAKNQFGGYAGAQPYWVAYFPEDGNIHVEPVTVDVGNAMTQCDSPRQFALQPELLGAPTPPTMSVAGEIEKLGELLNRGLITREEFDRQKAKLLSPN